VNCACAQRALKRLIMIWAARLLKIASANQLMLHGPKLSANRQSRMTPTDDDNVELV